MTVQKNNQFQKTVFLNNTRYLLELEKVSITQLELAIGKSRGFFYRSSYGDTANHGININVIIDVWNYFKDKYDITLEALLFDDLQNYPFSKLKQGDLFEIKDNSENKVTYVKDSDTTGISLKTGKKKDFKPTKKTMFVGHN